MGKVDHPFGFTGKVGSLLFYKTGMHDGIMVRQAKGIPGRRIKNDHNYGLLRKHSEEFKARNILSSIIYKSLWDIKPVFDHIFYNQMISRSSKIQNLENQNNIGKREIWFSQFGSLFEGLSFNKRNSWEQFIKSTADIQFDQEKKTFKLSIPELVPGEGFNKAVDLPYCRFLFVLTVVPDIVLTPLGYKPTIGALKPITAATGWLPCDKTLPATELQVSIPEITGEPYTFMLSTAISFGRMEGKMEVVKYVGAGRIMKVVNGQ